MRNFKGINLSGISDTRTRSALDELQLWAQDVAAGMGKITKGLAPNVKNITISGTTSHHNLTNLTDGDDHPQYLLLANRTGGQTIQADATNQLIINGPDATSNTSIFKIGYKPAIGAFVDLVRVRGHAPGGAGIAATMEVRNEWGTTDPTLLVTGVHRISNNGGSLDINPNSAYTLISGNPNAITFLGTFTCGYIALISQFDAAIPLSIQRRTAQTGNLTEWRSNVGAILSSVDKDGNITAPSFLLSGGDAFAKKATNELITGQWTFQPTTAGGVTTFQEDAGVSGTGYFLEFRDGSGNSLGGFTQQGHAFPSILIANGMAFQAGAFIGKIQAAGSLTANRTYSFPDITGTICMIAGVQTINSKVFDTACTLKAVSISSGVAFADGTTTTKKMRVILSGASASTNSGLAFISTADRTFTFPDKTGTVMVSSAGTTRRLFIPSHTFTDGASSDAVAGTAPSFYAHLPFSGITKQSYTGTIVLPMDMVASSTLTLKLLIANSATSTNGTYWTVYTLPLTTGTDATSAASNSNTVTITPQSTANGVTVSGAFTVTPYSPGDILRVVVERDPSNGADTNTDAMNFIGLQIEYTADV